MFQSCGTSTSGFFSTRSTTAALILCFTVSAHAIKDYCLAFFRLLTISSLVSNGVILLFCYLNDKISCYHHFPNRAFLKSYKHPEIFCWKWSETTCCKNPPEVPNHFRSGTFRFTARGTPCFHRVVWLTQRTSSLFFCKIENEFLRCLCTFTNPKTFTDALKLSRILL